MPRRPPFGSWYDPLLVSSVPSLIYSLLTDTPAAPLPSRHLAPRPAAALFPAFDRQRRPLPKHNLPLPRPLRVQKPEEGETERQQRQRGGREGQGRQCHAARRQWPRGRRGEADEGRDGCAGGTGQRGRVSEEEGGRRSGGPGAFGFIPLVFLGSCVNIAVVLL